MASLFVDNKLIRVFRFVFTCHFRPFPRSRSPARIIWNATDRNDRPTFGPWRPGIDVAERRARCRSMRAVAGLVAGPCADALAGHLLNAELDEAALDLAADAPDDLAPLDRRRILASYAARAAALLRQPPGPPAPAPPCHADATPLGSTPRRPASERHLAVMRSTLPAILASILAAAAMGPAQAGDLVAEVRARNALFDLARSRRDQTESLRAIERTQREQARRADRDCVNAQRDARSMRRFDRLNGHPPLERYGLEARSA
ncbi:hypothetical protein AFFFEF_01958 [Methylorubrum extorquens]